MCGCAVLCGEADVWRCAALAGRSFPHAALFVGWRCHSEPPVNPSLSELTATESDAGSAAGFVGYYAVMRELQN